MHRSALGEPLERQESTLGSRQRPDIEKYRVEIKGPSFGAIKIDTGAFLRRKVALFGLSKISKITLGASKMTFWVGSVLGCLLGSQKHGKIGGKIEVFRVDLESFWDVFEVFFASKK